MCSTTSGGIEEHRWSIFRAPGSTSRCIQPTWEHLGAYGRSSVAVQSGWVIQLWLPNHFTFCWWITASKCISKLARLRPQSASLSSLDLCLQVHLQTCSIMALKCTCEFTQSQTASASPHSHNDDLQVHFSVHNITVWWKGGTVMSSNSNCWECVDPAWIA